MSPATPFILVADTNNAPVFGAFTFLAVVKHFRPGALGTRHPALVMAAMTAALSAILHLVTGKSNESKLISTPDKVGREVIDGSDFDEFDVIIVGGGMFLRLWYILGTESFSYRDCWVCLGVATLGRPQYSRSSSRGRLKVRCKFTSIIHSHPRHFAAVAKPFYKAEYRLLTGRYSMANMSTSFTLSRKYSLLAKRHTGLVVGFMVYLM